MIMDGSRQSKQTWSDKIASFITESEVMHFAKKL